MDPENVRVDIGEFTGAAGRYTTIASSVMDEDRSGEGWPRAAFPGARSAGPVREIGSGRRRAIVVVLGALILIVLVFFGLRLGVDGPNLAAGTVPEDPYDRRYVEHPWQAYLHIVPGVIYLLGAPLQLSHRFRSRHYGVHRRLGRVLLGAALLSGVFALAFGVPFAFGDFWQAATTAAATVVFGLWFLACLLLAFLAIKRGNPAQHRRWMIRAFAVAVGVGTIRVWMGVFLSFGLLSLPASQAVAFWLAFLIHVVAAEWWLQRTPALAG